MTRRFSVACGVLLAAGLLAAIQATATSVNTIYVGSSAGRLYAVDVDTGEVRLLTTSTVSTDSINTLAANSEACLAYYGDATSIFRWDETTDAHTLISNLASDYPATFTGSGLDSGGGTFWAPTNTYYVGAEQPGDIEAVYALVMTPDGTGIATITRFDVQGDAAADTDLGDAVPDLGGFGDFISIDNGAGGVLLLGATRNSGTLFMWTYDPAGSTASARFTRLTPPPGNLNLQLGRTPDGRVWAGYVAPSGANAGDPVLRELDIDLGGRMVSFTGDEIPLSPSATVADLTGPACRPQIGIAKRVATGPAAVGDGTFNLTFELLVEALGDFTLWDVQVTDDLTAEFGTLVTDTPDAPGEYAVTAAPTITAENPSGAPPNSDLTANPDFDGDTDPNLLVLGSGDRLEVGATATIRLTIRFYPEVGVTEFENQATAEGDARENGTTDGDTRDDSDDGTEVDPDRDDNPDETGPGCAADPTADNCENDPTPISLPTPRLQIGIAKRVSTPVAVGNGAYTVTYTLEVANLGNLPLYDVQVTDDLTPAFGSNVAPAAPAAAGEFTAGSVNVAGQSGGATVATANTAYNGDSDAVLLGPRSGESMPVGSSFTVSFPVTFVPDDSRAPYDNQARATGDRVENQTADQDTTDLSDDGTDVDPNDNGNPGDPGEDDPTPLPPFPRNGTPIPMSGPLATALLVLALALVGWARLRSTF